MQRVTHYVTTSSSSTYECLALRLFTCMKLCCTCLQKICTHKMFGMSLVYTRITLKPLSSFKRVHSHTAGEGLPCVQYYQALGLPTATLSPASWGEACAMPRPFCLCETDHGPRSVLLQPQQQEATWLVYCSQQRDTCMGGAMWTS